MKILVVQTAYIGDVILATSMAQTIASLNPKAKIDFLVRNGNQDLLQNNPLISDIIVWNKKQKFKSLWQTLRTIRKEKYDAVINIQRFMNSGLLTGLSGAKTKIGFVQNPASFLFTHKIQHKIPHELKDGGHFHEVQRNAQLLSPLFPSLYPEDAKRPKLYFNQDIEEKVAPYKNEAYAVLAPTSVWFTKQWPAQRWKELSETLSKNLRLYFIGAPSDRKAIEEIIKGLPNCDNLAGQLSLLESACLMREAKRVFVNDSAPLHLASSVNAKTTAIFCSTVESFGYTPLSDDSEVISVGNSLECRPCGLHGKKECPLGHFKCGFDIGAERVSATLSEPPPSSEPEFVYHIARKEDYEEALERGFYSCDSLLSEAFIHFSYDHQTQDTGKRYYSNVEGLLLLKIKVSGLEDLRVENGFPHLYSILPLKNITSATPITFKT